MRATVRKQAIVIKRKEDEIDRCHKRELNQEKEHEKEKLLLARRDGKIRHADNEEPRCMKTRSRACTTIG